MSERRTDRTGIDRAKFTRTPQGGIKAPAYLTRVGVFTYWTADGTGNLRPFRELRLPEEVFHADSLASLAAAPVTIGHPKTPVDASNWKDLTVGHVADHVHADGRFVAAEVRVQDAAAVEKIEDGTLREFSCGYTCDVERKTGTHGGEHYDGIQRNIRYNHVGMGGKGWGRAGTEVRLRVDGAQHLAEDGDVDALAFGMTPEQIAALQADNQKLQGQADAEKARADAAAAQLVELTAKVTASEALVVTEKARADAAETARNDAAQLATPEAIDARVAARVALVDGARGVLGAAFKADGVSDRDVRIAAITKLDPTFKADGRSDDYVAGRFESVTRATTDATDAQVATHRAVVDAAGSAPTEGLIEKNQRESREASANAWKQTNVKR